MIADTSFVISFLREQADHTRGPARAFLAARRTALFRTTIVTAGEVAVGLEDSGDVWLALKHWTILRLHPGIVEAAADVDRDLIPQGRRLGENDNWIAGFARYYRMPVVSRDADFDRVPGLRRLAY